MSDVANTSLNETARLPKDIFYLNPAYQYMMTGQRNYGYIWSKIGWSGIIVAGFFLIVASTFVPHFVNEIRLATLPTKTTEAQVVSTRTSKGTKNSTNYYLTYSFSVNNRSYQHEVSISSSEYNSNPKGDWVTVSYLIDDPATSQLGLPGHVSGVLLPYAIIPAVIIGYVLYKFFEDLPRRRRVARLRRDGHLIFGQILSSSGMNVEHGSGRSRRTDYEVTVFYKFVNPDQKSINWNETFVRNDLNSTLLPKHGSVVVLYGSKDDFLML